MEVHLGKSHSDQFECVLWEFVAKDLENLDMLLFTCEIYQCEECEKRGDTYSTIIHAKQSRADSEKISVVEYSKHVFLTNNWSQVKTTKTK